jgi:hypothetical protein
LGLELVEGNEELLKDKRLIAISTKSKWLMGVLQLCDRWRTTGKWPKDSGSYRNMLIRIHDIVSALPETCKLVLVERGGEEEEGSEVKLDEFREKDDTTGRMMMDELGEYENPQEELSRRMRERKMRDLMLQRAISTGAKIVPNRKKK